MPQSTPRSVAETCTSYLDAWVRKDLGAIAEHLHPDVTFKGPMQQVSGRSAVLASSQRILPMLLRIENRAQFVDGDRAVLTYDFVCADPVGVCRTAEAVRVEGDLVREIELFYDARPFEALRRAAGG